MKYHFHLISSNRGQDWSQTYDATGFFFFQILTISQMLASLTEYLSLVTLLFPAGRISIGHEKQKRPMHVTASSSNHCKCLRAGVKACLKLQANIWVNGVAHSQLISAPSWLSMDWHFLICKIWADRTSPPAWGGGMGRVAERDNLQ